MRIISYNVNGVRAALQKGLTHWLATQNADVVLLQETKAQPEQIDTAAFEAIGLPHCYYHSAQKKGYSGVAILSKTKPNAIVVGCGMPQYDEEGRILRADFGDLSVISAYIPSGSSGEDRQAVKMQFLSDFLPWCENLRKERPKLIIGGDFNICHREIDIHDPKGNKKTSGFLPEERDWLSSFFNSGFTDTFRHFYPDLAHQYSWWSQRFNSRAKNKGWRIDYLTITTPLLNENLLGAGIEPDAVHSDHCPIWVNFK